MTEQAMRMALEALEKNRRTHHYCEDTWYSCPKHEEGCANDSEGDKCNCGADEANVEIDKAITALRQALTDAEARNCKNCVIDKPCVCKGKDFQPCGAFISKQDKQARSDALDKKAENARELVLDYEPVALEAKDEPVACKECHLKDTVYDLLDDLKVANLKLSVRSQRTWVGLTEKDICEAAVKSQEGISPRDDTLRFAIAIEAKLKEKNT